MLGHFAEVTQQKRAELGNSLLPGGAKDTLFTRLTYPSPAPPQLNLRNGNKSVRE